MLDCLHALMEEPSGTTTELWPLVSRSGVLSPSETVYKNVSTLSSLPPGTYDPIASGPAFSSKYRVPSTVCRDDTRSGDGGDGGAKQQQEQPHGVVYHNVGCTKAVDTSISPGVSLWPFGFP